VAEVPQLVSFVEFLMGTFFFEESEYKNKKITGEMLEAKLKQRIVLEYVKKLSVPFHSTFLSKENFELD
jgi:hypothetical protein